MRFVAMPVLRGSIHAAYGDTHCVNPDYSDLT